MSNINDIILVKDYKIGNQKNFDISEFYDALLIEEDDLGLYPQYLKEYHHSLFYPILTYCVDLLNSTQDKESLKYKVGIFGRKKNLYVTVGTNMYDLFFTEKEDMIDGKEIKFNYGKKNFLLLSIPEGKKKDSYMNSYKEFFNIPDDYKEAENKANELSIEVKQLMQSKKENIISKFLDGYSHQESVIKSFESKIKGKFIILPNLIFKSYDSESAIEEIDQIYKINLEKNLEIEEFNYFYFCRFENGNKTEEIINHKGIKLVLENDNIYILEIKKSIDGLKTDLDHLGNVELEKTVQKFYKSSSSKFSYKRNNLTGVGNTVLTMSIFIKLLSAIKINCENINLFYIVDSDYKPEMIKIFSDCLNRDLQMIKDLKISFKFYLIYTQPDLALRNFINENLEKNNKIEQLEKELYEKKKKLSEFEKIYEFIKVDKELIDFSEEIISDKKILITIGLLDTIKSKNHEYKFPDLKLLDNVLDKNLRDDYFIIDFKSFNNIKPLDKNNESLNENLLESFKNKMSIFLNFDEFYILVDFIFLQNISKIITEENFNEYSIKIYMFDNNKYMINLKKDNQSIIEFHKNKCKNNMLPKSQIVTLKEVEHFAINYSNLINKRNFFIDNSDKGILSLLSLFDFKCRNNYILEIYNQIANEKLNTEDYLVIIFPIKKEYNYLNDFSYYSLIQDYYYQKIIILRRTEFGVNFKNEQIYEIIKYLFNIKSKMDCEYINLYEEDSKVRIEKIENFYSNAVYRIIRNSQILPFSVSDQGINVNSIELSEYLFYLSLPMFILKNINKLNGLLLADDFGLLNLYFNKIYENKILFLSYVPEIIQGLEYLKDEKIKTSDFEKVINEKKKKNLKFDLIILEENKHNINDITIPNESIIFDIYNLLNDEGILGFNLRADTYVNYNKFINSIKAQFKKVIEINIRLCCGFIICSKTDNIKLLDKYNEIYPNIKNIKNIEFFIELIENQIKKK